MSVSFSTTLTNRPLSGARFAAIPAHANSQSTHSRTVTNDEHDERITHFISDKPPRRWHADHPPINPLTMKISIVDPPPSASRQHSRRALSLPHVNREHLRKSLGIASCHGTAPSAPKTCKCSTALIWPYAPTFMQCPSCALSHFASPREVETPPVPLPIPSLIPSVKQHRSAMQNTVPIVRMKGDDPRWCAVRQHPLDPTLVFATRASTVIAVLPRRQAAYARFLILKQWTKSTVPTTFISEYDINAYIVAWIENADMHPIPVPNRRPFRDQHFVWMPADALLEPGICRQAFLSPLTTPTPRWHQDASPFTDITDLGSPMNYELYERMLRGHPYRSWFLNGLRFGFSLMTDPPHRPLPAKRDTFSKQPTPEYKTGINSAVQKELDMRAFVRWPPPDLPVEDKDVYLRYTSLFGIRKPDGTLRMISHLSEGDQSVNSNTNRRSHFRARLAKLANVILFCNHHHRTNHDDPLVAVKYDAVKAFRQMPIMARQAVLTAHLVDGETYVNVRCPMGARASGDIMGPAISILRDYMAREWGIFSESYSDDHLIVFRTSLVHIDEPRARSLWQDSGWARQEDKLIEGGRPVPELDYLGVGIHLNEQYVYVTEPRREKMIAYISQWIDGSLRLDQREFARMSGRLQFISEMVPFGRAFTSSFFRFTSWAATPAPIPHPLPLDVRFDLHWWRETLSPVDSSNAIPTVSFREFEPVFGADIWTDAAKWGMAGVNHTTREYFVYQWQDGEESVAIALREGAAIIVAVLLWGALASSQCTLLNTDSESCSTSFTTLRCHDLRLRLMARVLSLAQMASRTPIKFRHVPTHENVDADALSRGTTTARLQSYTRVTVPGTILRFSTAMLLTWLADQSMAPSRIAQLYEHLRDIVKKSVTPHHSQTGALLHWTRWSAANTEESIQLDDSTTSPDGSDLTEN